jgi:hypothetical protein
MQANPDDITFERWSELSALMLGMDEDAKRDYLHASEIDDEAFDVAQTTHLGQLSCGVSRGDDTLANLHAENLRRRLAGELVPALPAPVELQATPESADVQQQESPRPLAEAVLVPSYLREQAPKAREGVAFCLDATVAPLPTSGPALPFRPGVFVPAEGREPAEARLTAPNQRAPVDPAGETLPLTSSKEETLPFAQSKVLRLMRVEHFAELSFELRQRPEARREILVRHGVESEERFTQLAQLWAQKLAENPNLRKRFDALTKTLQQKGPSR